MSAQPSSAWTTRRAPISASMAPAASVGPSSATSAATSGRKTRAQHAHGPEVGLGGRAHAAKRDSSRRLAQDPLACFPCSGRARPASSCAATCLSSNGLPPQAATAASIFVRSGPAVDSLIEQGDGHVGRKRTEPLQVHQALLGQLVGGPRQRRRPGPGGHDHRDGKACGQPAADQPEQGERIGVSPVGIVEPNQQRLDRHFPQSVPVAEPIGSRLIARGLLAPRAEHLAPSRGSRA